MGRQKNEQLPNEVWRRIANRKPMHGFYEVSNYGNVRHIFKTRPPRMMSVFMETDRRCSNYMCVKMCGNTVRVTHLVWEAFVGPLTSGMAIIHINGLKADNALWNLKAIDRKRIGELYGGQGEHGKKGRRTIARIDRDGNILNVYRSCRIAEREYGFLCYQSIIARCNHKIKRDDILPDGTTFRWEDEVSK